jgi:hypothetical protein
MRFGGSPVTLYRITDVPNASDRAVANEFIETPARGHEEIGLPGMAPVSR